MDLEELRRRLHAKKAGISNYDQDNQSQLPSMPSEEPQKELSKSEASKVVNTSGIPLSEKLYNYHLNNLETTLNYSISNFKNSRLSAIDKAIERNDISVYEKDRLRVLASFLCFRFFCHHFYDEDFYEDDKDKDLYDILDRIDGYIENMDCVTAEAVYLYNTANMFSAHRFQGVDKMTKLNELWETICSIHLDERETEFKVSYWKDISKAIYETMKEIYLSSENSYRNRESLRNRVFAILLDKLSIEEYELTPEARLTADLGADSLDAVEIMMEMEKEFGLTISEDEVSRLKTVGDIIRYVERHI